jgi:hypothetical protein
LESRARVFGRRGVLRLRSGRVEDPRRGRESFEGEEDQESNGQRPRGNPEPLKRSCKGNKASK